MSNFPIIPTTPPPLDINDSEEEEPDFGHFNGDDEDIEDFVVPVVTQNSSKHFAVNNNNNNIKTLDKKASVDDNECNRTVTTDDDTQTYSITVETNTCDDNSIKSMDHDINCSNDNEEYVDNISDDIKELDLESLPDTEPKEQLTEEFSEDISKDVVEDEKPVSDELNPISQRVDINNDTEDDDFADFTSFQFNSNSNQFEETVVEEDDDYVLSFYNSKSFSDMSFTDYTANVDNNSNAINSSQKVNENDVKDTESDDDFADFASAQPVFSTDFESVPDIKPTTFESTQFGDVSEAEFADFSSFQTTSTVNGFTEQHPIPEMVSVVDSDKLHQLFAQIFPIEETISCDENSQNISRDLFNSCDQNSKNLWKSLQDLESAPSLKLRWANSHSFQLLLTALNIDPRNILRNSSVPVFASGLGCVLEPTKHLYNSDLNDDYDIKTITTTSDSPTTATIPPVQFDWSSSGLTNPLDANQKSTAAFDLDFFVTNDDVMNTKKQTNFSDFDDFLNDKNGNNTTDPELTNKTNIMQQILSSVGSTSSATNPLNTDSSQPLSAEALQVLDELPNLSFIRAKVLMFPIINVKSQTNS